MGQTTPKITLASNLGSPWFSDALKWPKACFKHEGACFKEEGHCSGCFTGMI